MKVALITPDKDFEQSVAKSIKIGIRQWHGIVVHIRLKENEPVDDITLKEISQNDIFIVGTDNVLGNMDPSLLSFFSRLQKQSKEGRFTGKLGLCFGSSSKPGSLDALQAIHRVFLNFHMTVPVIYPDLHKKQKTLLPMFTSYGLLFTKHDKTEMFTEDMRHAAEIYGNHVQDLAPMVRSSSKIRKGSISIPKKKKRSEGGKKHREFEDEKNSSEVEAPSSHIASKLKQFGKKKKKEKRSEETESGSSEKKKSHKGRKPLIDLKKKKSKVERKKSSSSEQEEIKSDSSERKKKTKKYKQKTTVIKEGVIRESSSSRSSSESTEEVREKPKHRKGLRESPKEDKGIELTPTTHATTVE